MDTAWPVRKYRNTFHPSTVADVTPTRTHVRLPSRSANASTRSLKILPSMTYKTIHSTSPNASHNRKRGHGYTVMPLLTLIHGPSGPTSHRLKKIPAPPQR